jgi:ubiquinol-cytochrome c reductase iron-sulfur subunit
MADIANVHGGAPHPAGETRRDFLVLAGTALGAVAAATAVWPLISSMNPAADTLAAGGPVDVDLGKLAPGQQIVVMWRGAPIFVVNRTPEALALLQKADLVEKLRDPDSQVHQQPPYADNWHRSADPQFAVLVGICTHLGCVPNFLPKPNPTSPSADWPGGYFCPCHGSKYDLAGRVYKGVPAPYNLPVPPYNFTSKTTLRIGENPTGVAFELSSVQQM